MNHKEFMEEVESLNKFKEMYFRLIEGKFNNPELSISLNIIPAQEQDAKDTSDISDDNFSPLGFLEHLKKMSQNSSRRDSMIITLPSYTISQDMMEQFLHHIINEKTKLLNEHFKSIGKSMLKGV